MIRCIIVEDEILAQHVLQNHLERMGNLELVAICNNAMEAKEVLNNREVDLMFLDIQLPGMTGLHFLKSLSAPPLVVLTTAYSEYAVESYEFNIADYLLKPVSFERFCKAIEKVQEMRSSFALTASSGDVNTDHIFIKSNTKFFKVNFSDITYIKGMRDYLKVRVGAETIVTLQTMNEMEKVLPVRQFMRVHKSYIVSLSSIKSIHRNSIEIENATIPIGISYKEKVMEFIGNKHNA